MRGRWIIWWLLLYQAGADGAYVGHALPLPSQSDCHAVREALRRSVDPLPVVAYVCREGA